MAAASKDYRYSVELNIHAIDAPGTRLTKTGDIYLNICLLGMHKRTRRMPPYLPMHVDQKLYFDKIFKFCTDPEDIIPRLEREHVLIELIQNEIPSPILLASYEILAKDFLYPYSSDRIEYTGLRRYLLLNRTVDFPGISPSFEFSTSPSVDDVTGLSLGTKTRRQNKTKRPKSPSWRPSSSIEYRTRLNSAGNMGRSVTSQTISSALKHDYSQRETEEKLQELAVEYNVKPVKPIDKTRGRPPFVVRHVGPALIARPPKSHETLRESLEVNDYSPSRDDTSFSLNSLDGGLNRSRSISPVLGRSIKPRARSPSPLRNSVKLSQSVDFERSRSPQRRSHNALDDLNRYDDIYSENLSRSLMSPTLHRPSFRYRYRYSPASDLSSKVIQTLRRNLDSYTLSYPSPYTLSNSGDVHWEDDDILERSRRLTYAY